MKTPPANDSSRELYAKKSCKHCYGRGYMGYDLYHKRVVVCKCVSVKDGKNRKPIGKLEQGVS